VNQSCEMESCTTFFERGGIVAPRLCAAVYSIHGAVVFFFTFLAFWDWEVLFRIFFVPTETLPKDGCPMVLGVEDRPECLESLTNWHCIIFGAWSGFAVVTGIGQALLSSSPSLLLSLRRGMMLTMALFSALLQDLAYPMLLKPDTGLHALEPKVNISVVAPLSIFYLIMTIVICITLPTPQTIVTHTAPLKSLPASKFRLVCFLDAVMISIVVIFSEMATEFLLDFTHKMEMSRSTIFFQRANQCHQACLVMMALGSACSNEPFVWASYSRSWFAGFIPCMFICFYSRYIMASLLRLPHYIADAGVPVYILFHLAFLPPSGE